MPRHAITSTVEFDDELAVPKFACGLKYTIPQMRDARFPDSSLRITTLHFTSSSGMPQRRANNPRRWFYKRFNLASVRVFQSSELPIRDQLIWPLSQFIQIKKALPISSSSGTVPQKRLSRLLSRLSPSTK